MVGKLQTKAFLARFGRKRVNNDDKRISNTIYYSVPGTCYVLRNVRNEIFRRRTYISKWKYDLGVEMQT